MSNLKKKLECYLLDSAFIQELSVPIFDLVGRTIGVEVPYHSLTDFLDSRKSQELSVWKHRQYFAYFKHFYAKRTIACIDHLDKQIDYQIKFYEENGFYDESQNEEDFISIEDLYDAKAVINSRVTKNLKRIIEIEFLENLLTYGFLDHYRDWIRQSPFHKTGHYLPFWWARKSLGGIKSISYLLTHDFGKDVGVNFRKLRAEKAEVEEAKLDAELQILLGVK